jgi:acyl-CoA reductase-like NAD-dependent aldehyde dehydrogenase
MSTSICNKRGRRQAVRAAKMAFHKDSEWRKMNPRDCGHVLNRLANLMEKNKKELSTLES